MDSWRNVVWRTLQEAYRTRWYGTVNCETSSTWRSRSSRRVVWTSKATISLARATVPGTSRFASKHILNLCKNMKNWVIWTRLMKTQSAQRNGITFHITRFSRVPAVQHALALFLMALGVRVTDCLWMIHFLYELQYNKICIPLFYDWEHTK